MKPTRICKGPWTINNSIILVGRRVNCSLFSPGSEGGRHLIRAAINRTPQSANVRHPVASGIALTEMLCPLSAGGMENGDTCTLSKVGAEAVLKTIHAQRAPRGANVIMIAIVRAERLRRVIRFALDPWNGPFDDAERTRLVLCKYINSAHAARRGLILSTSAPGKMPRSRAVTCPINSAPCSQTQINGDTANWEISLINKVDGKDGNVSFCWKHSSSHVGIVVRFHQLSQ